MSIRAVIVRSVLEFVLLLKAVMRLHPIPKRKKMRITSNSPKWSDTEDFMEYSLEKPMD